MTIRNNILNATEALLRARGVAGTTTKEIAAAAGCAEGSIYRHFPDKGALLFAAVEEHLPSLDKTLAVADGDPRSDWERVIVAIVDYLGQVLPLAIGLAADVEWLEQNRERMRVGQIGPHRLLEFLVKRFTAAQADGRVNPAVEPLTLATLVAGPCFQYAFMRHFAGEVVCWESPTQFAKSVAEPLLTLTAPVPRARERKRKRKTH